jgi:hypothetical protein
MCPPAPAGCKNVNKKREMGPKMVNLSEKKGKWAKKKVVSISGRAKVAVKKGWMSKKSSSAFREGKLDKVQNQNCPPTSPTFQIVPTRQRSWEPLC